MVPSVHSSILDLDLHHLYCRISVWIALCRRTFITMLTTSVRHINIMRKSTQKLRSFCGIFLYKMQLGYFGNISNCKWKQAISISKKGGIESIVHFQIEFVLSWWRYQMETVSALLALCAGNSPVTGEFPSQRPVTWSFDVFLDLHLNKRLVEQS